MAILSHDPNKCFGKQLRRLRTQLGWSQEKLAFEAGLDRSYVGGVERGERNISLRNIYRLATALGISAKALFDPRTNSGRLAKKAVGLETRKPHERREYKKS
jgi:transcriptional regulator with XRE-family HTH domain